MSKTFRVRNADISITAYGGRPELVSDNVKLRQDILEFFSVNVMPNGFGSGIEQLVGIADSGEAMFISLVHNNIREGLDNFIRLQNSDPAISRPKSERISSISGLVVSRDTVDKTKYLFQVNFITVDGKSLSFSHSTTVG